MKQLLVFGAEMLSGKEVLDNVKALDGKNVVYKITPMDNYYGFFAYGEFDEALAEYFGICEEDTFDDVSCNPIFINLRTQYDAIFG